jgi:hypothetical protein
MPSDIVGLLVVDVDAWFSKMIGPICLDWLVVAAKVLAPWLFACRFASSAVVTRCSGSGNPIVSLDSV